MGWVSDDREICICSASPLIAARDFEIYCIVFILDMDPARLMGVFP